MLRWSLADHFSIMSKLKFILPIITALSFSGLIGIASASAPTLSKAYSASTNIAPGSIVRLVPGSHNLIAPANTSNPSGLIGVSESTNNSLLAINPSKTTVQVALGGDVETLVSNISGAITQGSYVAVSPFGGMGMASSPGNNVIGIAEANFNSSTPGAKEQKVTNKAGHSLTIWTGQIPVKVDVGVAPDSNSNINVLQKLARSITGHVIPTGRVVIALVIAMTAFTTLVTLTYSATFSSIISIGRNPLARGAILQGLSSLVLIAMGIGVVASLLIYLLLR